MMRLRVEVARCFFALLDHAMMIPLFSSLLFRLRAWLVVVGGVGLVAVCVMGSGGRCCHCCGAACPRCVPRYGVGANVWWVSLPAWSL